MHQIVEENRVCNRRASDLECAAMSRVAELELAFPDGVHNHREAHVAWMEAKKAEKEFYASLKKEVMTKGIAGLITLIVVIIGLAVTGLLHKLGISSNL